jgi:hypothetical protein
MDLFPKYLLDFCTILGGFTALVSIYKKVRVYFKRKMFVAKTMKEAKINKEYFDNSSNILINGYNKIAKFSEIKYTSIVIMSITVNLIVFISKSNVVLMLIGMSYLPLLIITDSIINKLIFPKNWYNQLQYIQLNNYIESIKAVIALSLFMIMFYGAINYEIYEINKKLFYYMNSIFASVYGIKELIKAESEKEKKRVSIDR